MPPSFRPARAGRSGRGLELAPRGAGLLASLVLLTVAGAARGQLLVQVTPSQMTLTVNPGEAASREILVSNLGSVAAAVRVRLSDWSLAERGEMELAPLGATAGTLAEALRFEPRQLEIGPGGSGRIRITALLGAAGRATRWGMLLCEVRPARPDPSDVGPPPVAELGTAMLVSRIPADQVHTEIIGLRAEALGRDSMMIAARIRNTGQRQVLVSGGASLADSNGVRLGGGEFPPGLVLPAMTRTFIWAGRVRPAPRGCVVSARLETGEPELIVAETGFDWPPARSSRATAGGVAR